MILRPYSLIALAVLICSSCSKAPDFLSDNLSAGWAYDNSVRFDIDPVDQKMNEIEIVVNHSIDYAYENLYLKLELSDQSQTSTDTISIQLANNNGLWKSKCSGTDCLLRHSYKMDETVSAVSISQFSREAVLRGINQIGINLK